MDLFYNNTRYKYTNNLLEAEVDTTANYEIDHDMATKFGKVINNAKLKNNKLFDDIKDFVNNGSKKELLLSDGKTVNSIDLTPVKDAAENVAEKIGNKKQNNSNNKKFNKNIIS